MMRLLGRLVVLVGGATLVQFAVGKPLWLAALALFLGVCLIEWWAIDKYKDRNGL